MMFQSGEESSKCDAELGKIIKYCKTRENNENFAIFTIIPMTAYGNKNVHSAMTYFGAKMCKY